MSDSGVGTVDGLLHAETDLSRGLGADAPNGRMRKNGVRLSWHYDKPTSDTLIEDFLSGDMSGHGQ